MLRPLPVRPPIPKEETLIPDDLPAVCGVCEEDSLLYGEDEDVDLDLADIDDPIVGVERVISDEHGPGALPPRPIPSPPSMTPAAFLKHSLTHLPYHPGCPICVATRRPNSQHRRSRENARTIPLLVGDYGFIRSSSDAKEDMQNVLVLRVLPYKLSFASIVPVKGLDQMVAARIARFIRDAGLVHFAYRSDREMAMTALLEEAIRLSGRRGVVTDTNEPPLQFDFPIAAADDDEPDAPTQIPQRQPADATAIAVPELTHPVNHSPTDWPKGLWKQSRTMHAR